MKLLYTFVFLVGMTPLLFGQLTKGGSIIDLNGSFGYETQKRGTPDETVYEGWEHLLAFRYLHLVTDHWAVGGTIGGYRGFGVNVGPLAPEVRYYFNPESESINWFAIADAIFTFQSDLFFEQLNIGAGANLFLSPNVALEGRLNARFPNDDRGSLFNDPWFNISTGLMFYLSQEDRKSWKSAQPVMEKGAWMLGAVASDIQLNINDFRNTAGIQVGPSIGYFLSDYFVAGIGLDLGFSHIVFNKDSGPVFPESTFNTFNAGANIFSRYYLGAEGARLQPFLHGQIGVAHNRFKAKQGELDGVVTHTWVTTDLGVGANLFIAPGLALEGSFNYATTDWPKGILSLSDFQETPSTDISRFTFELGFQVFLGKGWRSGE
ncbi:MAG: hypothetical protein AAFZ15_00030 [Bacteroidota bacterium]